MTKKWILIGSIFLMLLIFLRSFRQSERDHERVEESVISSEMEGTDSGEEASKVVDRTEERKVSKGASDSSPPQANKMALFEGDVELDENRLAFQQVFEEKSKKYPFILLQRLWRISPSDPTQKIFLGERRMVADHLLVKLHSASEESSFESNVLSHGMHIRKKMQSPGLYIVEFDLEAHDSLQKAQKRLLELPEVRSVSPDFISEAVR